MASLRPTLLRLLRLDRPRRRDGVFGVAHQRRHELEAIVGECLARLSGGDHARRASSLAEEVFDAWERGVPEAVMEGGLSWPGRHLRPPLPPDAPHSSALCVGDDRRGDGPLIRVRVERASSASPNQHASAPSRILVIPPAGRGLPPTEDLPEVHALLASRPLEVGREVLAELDALRAGPDDRPLHPDAPARLNGLMDVTLAQSLARALSGARDLLPLLERVREALGPVAEALATLEAARWAAHLAPAQRITWAERLPPSGVLLVCGPNGPVLEAMAEQGAPRFDLAFLDPPYNTRSSLRRYADSRSASDWLASIHGTLKPLHACLHAHAVLFSCIDDNEVSRLRLLMNELHLYELSCVVVKMSELSGPKMKHAQRMFPRLKEYLLVHGLRQGTSVKVPRHRKNADTLLRYCKYYTHVILNPDAPVEKWELAPLRQVMAEQGEDDPDPQARMAWQIANAERMAYRTNNKAIAQWRANHPDAPEITSVEGPGGRRWIAWGERELLRLSDFLDAPLGDLWLDISTINLRRELMGLPAYRGGQKPLALLDRVLECAPGDNVSVVDPWAGSGTTGHAALRRIAAGKPTRALLVESSPEAFALAAERLRRVAHHHGLPVDVVCTLDVSG